MADLNKFEREKIIEPNRFAGPMGNRKPVINMPKIAINLALKSFKSL